MSIKLNFLTGDEINKTEEETAMKGIVFLLIIITYLTCWHG